MYRAQSRSQVGPIAAAALAALSMTACDALTGDRGEGPDAPVPAFGTTRQDFRPAAENSVPRTTPGRQGVEGASQRPTGRATMTAVTAPPSLPSPLVPMTGGGGPRSPVGYVSGVVPAAYGNSGAQSVGMPARMPGTGRGQQPSDSAEDTEAYEYRWDNPFLAATEAPLSTFAIDVDTASLANVRRFLQQGQMPPLDAVRIEELVNYFAYADPAPAEGEAFAVHVEEAAAPWAPHHSLVRIALTTKPIPAADRPPVNLVLLLDVSGSMQTYNKLPLVKSALKLLVEQLRADDRVAIVVYAGAAGLVLPSTPGDQTGVLLAAIDQLEAGGSTAGSEGIRLAYEEARGQFVPGGVNRVILATDGDFNVGVTSREELIGLIEEEAAGGVFLTALGFGMGNLKDETLESLADRGNGNYAYIDTKTEAKKVFVDEIGQNLVTVAKDVKVQVEFNPRAVTAYRLLGYENRLLAAQDFNDDTKDGGEVGAGHVVTVLYEVVPAGLPMPAGPTLAPTPTPDTGTPSPDAVVDPLRYADPAIDHGELLTIKVRYKLPEGSVSERRTVSVAPVRGSDPAYASDNWRFAAAVAAFGMLLRDSPYAGAATYAQVADLARSSLGDDPRGLRAGFLELVDLAAQLDAGVAPAPATGVPPATPTLPLPGGPPDSPAYP